MSQGNNALWHYTIETAKEAKSRDFDALGMYNLTLQAASWDGSNYAQRVALVQVMMVILILSRKGRTGLWLTGNLIDHQLAFAA